MYHYDESVESFKTFLNTRDMLQYVHYKFWKLEWFIEGDVGETVLFDAYLLSLKGFEGCIPLSKMDFTKEIFLVHTHNLLLTSMNEDISTRIGDTIEMVVECDV